MAAAPPAEPPSASLGSLRAGYERLVSDMTRNWWDAGYKIPRIRPTRGGNSSPQAFDVGSIHNKAAKPSFWQMAEYTNFQYWDWRITRSPEMKARIVSQWAYIRSVFPDAALRSAAKSSGIINVSDDAAWELNYLVQVHEVTNDPRALADAVALLPRILDRFADPNAPRVRYGALQASPYGILYNTNADDRAHGGRSSAYEVMIADAALSIYQRNHNKDLLNYAIGTYGWMEKYMRHPTRGYFYCELDLRPTVNGARNPHYRVPMGDRFGPPVRGLSSSYSGGTMAMGVAAARLYRITGEQPYLDEARRITAVYVKPKAFLRPGDLFVNERDAWTDGHWAPYFADEVLSLPGVDPDGKWKTAIRATAQSILNQRTPDGFYGADWSGPERNPKDGTMTWAEQAPHRNGMAVPSQIMTSSSSAAMVSAAIVAESQSNGDERPGPH
jgi:hypothetical protein